MKHSPLRNCGRYGDKYGRNISAVLLFFVFACFQNSQSFAHDPGLSYAKLSLTADSVKADLTFSKREIENLVHQNNIDLVALAEQMVSLKSEDKTYQAESIKTRVDGSDAYQFSLVFTNIEHKSLTYEAPLLKQLARGHRQFLTIEDQSSRSHQHLLSANNNQVLLNANEPTSSIFVNYLVQGTWHIWIGFDHLLFLLTLLLPAVMIYRSGLWQAVDGYQTAFLETVKIVTAFTLAHSITLALAVTGAVDYSITLIESAIALSVIVAALNNVWPLFTQKRWLMSFAFGLLHGFGFAGALAELGLSQHAIAIPLIAFNLGVEAGQLFVVGVLFAVLYAVRKLPLYRVLILKTGSSIIAAIGTVRFVQRAF